MPSDHNLVTVAFVQSVVLCCVGGGYAEYCVVEEALAMPIPAAMSMQLAGSIPEVWLTAFQVWSVAKFMPDSQSRGLATTDLSI